MLPVVFVAIGNQVLVIGNEQIRVSKESGIENAVVLPVPGERRHGVLVEGRSADGADRLELAAKGRNVLVAQGWIELLADL